MLRPLFLAHGSPMLALEKSMYGHFLDNLGPQLDPEAVVVFTAHWERDIPTLTFTDEVYETIHDFWGFPEELYAVRYPARGSKSVASLLEERFNEHGIAVQKDSTRGLDHGTWVPLSRMFPKAHLPVVQISVNPYLPPDEQFKIGQALQGLGQEGILIIGSGGTVHNLRLVKWGQTTPEPWAVEFDDWLIDKIENRDLDSLFQYEQLAPHARLAVPRAEHFVPLFIAMGSGDPESKPEVIYRNYEYGNISYLSFQF